MASGPAKLEINSYRRSDFGRVVPLITVRFISWGAKTAGQSNGVLVGRRHKMAFHTVQISILDMKNINEGLSWRVEKNKAASRAWKLRGE
jgi:hypothetical protein